MSSSMRCRKGVMGRMIFMRRLLAGREMSNAAERACHAADAGVIVGQRAQGGLDEIYEVEMVWEEGVLPERSERFSARENMAHVPYFLRCYRKAMWDLTKIIDWSIISHEGGRVWQSRAQQTRDRAPKRRPRRPWWPRGPSSSWSRGTTRRASRTCCRPPGCPRAPSITISRAKRRLR